MLGSKSGQKKGLATLTYALVSMLLCGHIPYVHLDTEPTFDYFLKVQILLLNYEIWCFFSYICDFRQLIHHLYQNCYPTNGKASEYGKVFTSPFVLFKT